MPSLLKVGGPTLRVGERALLAGRWLDGEAPPPGPLRVPLCVRSAVAIRRPPVTVGHGFAPGEVPAGSRVTLSTPLGERVAVQQDAENAWPDGSLRYAVLSFVAPESFCPGRVCTYFVGAEAGTPDRTPIVALADLAGRSDFRLRLSGHDFGADVFEAAVNDLLAAPCFPYGVNPTRGVDAVAVGPIRQEWRFWCFPERVSDGAIHRTLKVWLYVRYWPRLEAFEIVPRVTQENLYGAHPAGTAGPSLPTRQAGIAELFNGGARIAAFGGPADPRAVRVPVSAFTNTPSRYEMPAVQKLGFDWAGGVGVGLKGDLPIGLNGTDVYWPMDLKGAGKLAFAQSRARTHEQGNAVLPGGYTAWTANASNAGDANATVVTPDGLVLERVTVGVTGATPPMAATPFQDPIQDGTAAWRAVTLSWAGTGGSGTVTVYPVVHCFAGTGWIGMEADARPVWVGPGAKPDLMVAHDELHLTRRTRLVPPYELGLQRVPLSGLPAAHEIGAVRSSVIWNIEATSDGGEVDRIGWLPYNHAAVLLTPFDSVRDRAVRRLALSWADYTIWWTDERAGMPPVLNAGPAGDGVTYPGFAPCNETVFLYTKGNGGVGVGSPAFGGYEAWPSMTRGPNASGYAWNYNTLNSGAHLPNFWVVPYLRTGHQVYLDMGAANAISVVASQSPIYTRNRTIGARRYCGIISGQQRGMAWAYRELSNYLHLAPSDASLRPMILDIARDNAEFFRDYMDHSPGRHLGLPFFAGDPGSINPAADMGGRPFQHYMLAFSLGMVLWRGDHPQWRPFVDAYAGYIVDTFDDARIPGCGWLSNEYGLIPTDQQNLRGSGVTPWASTAEFLEKSSEPAFSIPAAGAAPYPVTGLRRNGATYQTPQAIGGVATDYFSLLMAAQAMWQTVGIRDVARVRRQLLSRALSPGTTGLQFSGMNPTTGGAMLMCPQWAVVPLA